MGSVGRLSSVLTWRRLLVAALVLGGAGLVYAFTFSKPDMIYARKVDEVFLDWEKFADERRMRLEGVLVAGSLVRLESCEYRFRLTSKGREIPVRFSPEPDGKGCPGLPDTFCETPGDARKVTVEGYLEGTVERPSFVADKVMALYRGTDFPPRCPPVPLAR